MRETVIDILTAIVCDSEADIETPKALTYAQARELVEALQYGSAHLRTLLATKVGSPVFTFTALQFTIDGTNYATLKTFDDAVACSAEGEKALAALNGYAALSDARIAKVRLVMGGSAPDGSNKITATVQLVLQVPQ